MTGWPGRWRVRCFARSERGVSAVEFALVSPFLLMAALALVDIGRAVGERMTLDRVLRGAAQSAMTDPGPDKVRSVAQTSAGGSFAGAAPVLSVARVCACAETPTTETLCSSGCDGDQPTAIYYRLAGSLAWQGLILPEIDLSATAEVQIR